MKGALKLSYLWITSFCLVKIINLLLGASLLALAKSICYIKIYYYLRACLHRGVELQVGEEIRLSM